MFHHFLIWYNLAGKCPLLSHQGFESVHMGCKSRSPEVCANTQNWQITHIPLGERMPTAMKTMKASSPTAMKQVKKPLQTGTRPLKKGGQPLKKGKKIQCKAVTSEKGKLEQIGPTVLEGQEEHEDEVEAAMVLRDSMTAGEKAQAWNKMK